MRLGKLPAAIDARTLTLCRYALPEALPIPPACDWISLAREGWPVYSNDVLGTCTVASAAHMVHAWSAAVSYPRGAETVIPEPSVLKTYSALSGYDGRAETDVGATALDTLKTWRKSGIAGHRIGAFAAIDPADEQAVRASIAIFGGCYVGLQMPLAARGRDVWGVSPTEANVDAVRGSWGGHAVPILAFDDAGLVAISCGEPVRMTWGFLRDYADEAYATIGEDFLREGTAPNGLNLDTLRSDLALITSDA